MATQTGNYEGLPLENPFVIQQAAQKTIVFQVAQKGSDAS
jgi:hypothetical protein